MKTNTQNTESGLLSRSEQRNTARTQINFARRRVNRSLDSETLLAVLRGTAPRFFALAEVVGQWVWISFEQKQPQEITRQLAQLGFHWNRTRQTWQHPCGMYCRESSWIDPRRIYGSYFAAD